MKKVVWPGLLLGVIILVVNMVVGYLFMLIPSVKADYATEFMRSWQDPVMLAFFLYPFILGLSYAWLWSLTKGSFKGKSRGCHFGWVLFLVMVFPGMYVTWTSFNLSILTVLSWLVSGFVSAKIAGFLLVKMNP